MIREITAHEAYPMLLQAMLSSNGERCPDTIRYSYFDCFREKVPCYELFCNISREAVETAYNGMKGQESDQ